MTDLLPLGALAPTPSDLNPAWFALVAVLLPAAVWFACAWRRALSQDPNALRRSGIRELRRLLAKLRRAPGAPSPAHLHAWLRATARAWNVRASAPTAAEVSSAQLAITQDPALTAQWRAVWDATERALFGAPGQTPPDWVARASAAAAPVTAPKRERWFPNRLADWLPSTTAGVLLAVLLLPGGATAQRSSEEAMTPSAVQSVEQAAARALARSWNDWTAHHALARTRAELQDWSPALAHALAAFAQAPSAATRETLGVVLAQNEPAARALRPLLSGSWYERVPARLSPARWQHVALVAAAIAGLLASAIVLVGYRVVPRPRGRAPGWLLPGAAVLSVALFAVAVASWAAYGPLANPHAAVIREAGNVAPVPTDLVPEEQTSPVVSGTVVLAGGTFLGWRAIELVGTDRSGWVRSSNLFPVYAR